ncbi:hypothetical protein CR513_13697, partial [Mucuna pruriens]
MTFSSSLEEQITAKIKAHEESIVEEQDLRERDDEKEEKTDKMTIKEWEKCLQLEIQQESLPQIKIFLHQLIDKERKYEKHDSFLDALITLFTNNSLTANVDANPSGKVTRPLGATCYEVNGVSVCYLRCSHALSLSEGLYHELGFINRGFISLEIKNKLN